MIQNILSNPTLFNMTQSTATQVTIETCLKAAGRPSFILMDNQIDKDTKKFAAMKEFLYQMTCLGIYLAVIIPVFKKGAFKIAQKMFKDEAVFKAFKTPEEFLKFQKLEEAQKLAKIEEINKTVKSGDKFVKENINENLAKGVIEGSSIFGSITGLAIVAPIVSHPLIHPVLKTLGFSDHKNEQKVDENKSKVEIDHDDDDDHDD